MYWRNAAVKYQLLMPDFSRVHDCLNVDDSIYSSVQCIMRRRVVCTEHHELMPDLSRVYCHKQQHRPAQRDRQEVRHCLWPGSVLAFIYKPVLDFSRVLGSTSTDTTILYDLRI